MRTLTEGGRARAAAGNRGEKQHSFVLARPLAGSAALAGMGAVVLVLVGWPASPLGAIALAVAALTGCRAVWRWERTRVEITAERIVVVHGTFRRRSASAPLRGAVEVEQTLLGRLLGYGTVTAGELEVPYVPRELVSRIGRTS